MDILWSLLECNRLLSSLHFTATSFDWLFSNKCIQYKCTCLRQVLRMSIRSEGSILRPCFPKASKNKVIFWWLRVMVAKGDLQMTLQRKGSPAMLLENRSVWKQNRTSSPWNPHNSFTMVLPHVNKSLPMHVSYKNPQVAFKGCKTCAFKTWVSFTSETSHGNGLGYCHRNTDRQHWDWIFFCCLWVKMGVLTGGALLHNGQGEQLPSCMPLSLQNKGNALPNYSQNQSANGMFWNFGLIKNKKNYSSGVEGTLSAQQSLCTALRKQWKWQFSNMLCTAVMQK